MLGRLRPIGLTEFGLREAIENTVGFWRRRRPEIRYEVTISAECDDLGELVGTTIYRIVQEALSNAVRHAEPTLITVSIDRDCEGVRVEVADDGRGTQEPVKPGYGLVGIGERVRAIGGRLDVSSKPGGGFSLGAVLPCPSRREAACVSVQALEL
jgi:two-component system sensor histidine kinase UhpB